MSTRKRKFDPNAAFLSIVGAETEQDEPKETPHAEAPPEQKAAPQAPTPDAPQEDKKKKASPKPMEEAKAAAPAAPTLKTKPAQKSATGKKQSKSQATGKLLLKGFYITESQQRALRLRVALSDDPEEKDMSAVVRRALDAYLAE